MSVADVKGNAGGADCGSETGGAATVAEVDAEVIEWNADVSDSSDSSGESSR